MTLPLSVLDVSPLPPDGDGATALQNTLDLAQHAEALGYGRFWVAEHHNMAGLAGVAPEVLIGVIAQRTSRIRVGSGGVLLPNYAPLKLAELEGFAQVAPSAFPPEHQLHEVIASPENVVFPPIFLLGSGQLSAQIAAERGRGFASAYFFSPDESAQAIHTYKERFVPSPHFARPHAILTVGVICAETDEEAEGLARASQLTGLRRLNGVRGGFASVDEARAYSFSAEEQEQLRRFAPIAGGPETVHAALTELAARLDADELMIATNLGEHALRRRSFELVAEAFALAGQPVAN